MIIRTILLVIIMLGLVGCATNYGAKSNAFSADWIPEATSKKVFVMPISTTSGFKDKYFPVLREVFISEITELGHAVFPKTLNVKDDGAISIPLIFQTNQTYKERLFYPQKFYSSMISKAPGMDIYLFPSIVPRVAELEDKTAKWDGVSQVLRMEGGTGIGTWSGKQLVYSVRIEQFDANGKWLLTSYGGISLPKFAHMPTRELRPKEDLFADDYDHRVLVRGIRKSIAPLKIRKE